MDFRRHLKHYSKNQNGAGAKVKPGKEFGKMTGCLKGGNYLMLLVVGRIGIEPITY